jgi:uncharacterized protein (TIGR02453 family)
MEKKAYILDFLEALTKNNSKEWMDENRAIYNQAKQYWLEEIARILERLSKHDAYFEKFSPKDTIMRINNNRRFQPDLPIYKNFFAFSPMSKEDSYARIFFSFSPYDSFIGGGLWRPQKEILEEVRAAIHYDGDELSKAIQNQSFVNYFGGLQKDEQALKNVPRGYDKEHPHAELLKYKNITASITPSKEFLLENDLADILEETYLNLKPVLDFLHKALVA